MNVLPFRPRPRGRHWTGEELAALIAACEARAAADWDTGATETGDPQFYILENRSALECRLTISRIADIYVLEDGHGAILAESRSVDAVATLAASVDRPSATSRIAARLLLTLAAIRAGIEDHLTPVLMEDSDLCWRLAPHLAGLV